MSNQDECPSVVDKSGNGEKGRASLSTDYGEIAQLTELLNVQITHFVQRVNGMVESIPCQDALSEIFREHSMKYDVNESMGSKQVSEAELRVSLLADEHNNFTHSADKV